MSLRELGFVHNTLKLLALAWPFLIVRGVFGILQGEIFIPGSELSVRLIAFRFGMQRP